MTQLFSVSFRFYGSLNDFLHPLKRQQMFIHWLKGNPSIKDTIEALGVPHPEVELILRNGEPVDFSYGVKAGDFFSIYPHFSSLKLNFGKLRNPLLENRFVLDVHLGKLANQMRLLGFDTLYQNNYLDEELAQISHQEQRFLLTRDLALLKRSIVIYGYWIRSKNPESQLKEVLNRFHLFSEISPFKRCLRCNGLITSVDKNSIQEQLKPLTKEHYQEFYQCSECSQIYWRGSHYPKLQNLIEKICQSFSATNNNF